MPESRRQSRSRIVIDAPRQYRRRPPPKTVQRNAELWVAISILVAAALATFFALFLTSRPFDPMNSSLAPQQMVPSAPSFTPTPKPSASATATPQSGPSNESTPTALGGQTANLPTDDASIQSRIDAALAADASLSKLDVSTLVEGGKVTIVGSVRSVELKQRIERTIRSVKGVAAVDNQLIVTEATPQ